ncbi:MAG: hypothetical protein IJ123_02070 [Blautia sp.]|nr:hypothetical protein [Blautia sp.]
MPTNEKEYNGYLLDQLHALQRIEKIAKKIGNEELLEAIEEEKRFVNEKLYQNPSLTAE